jgi:hypothetical protein
MSKYITICCLLLFVFIHGFSQQLTFKGGHSHNDYHQKRPFYEAYEHGMVSIEADVFLRDDKLFVGHEETELTKARTLKNLYLDPLLKLADAPDFKPIILLVDIKDKGRETYEKLKNVLHPYESILTHFYDNHIDKRQVTVIISGDRPTDLVGRETDRYIFVDGRLSDLENPGKEELIPLISDNWQEHFLWRGKGKIAEAELQKLQKIVDTCHQQNRIIRFWGIPTDPEKAKPYWDLITKVGVDLIGCDNPAALKEYLDSNNYNAN